MTKKLIIEELEDGTLNIHEIGFTPLELLGVAAMLKIEAESGWNKNEPTDAPIYEPLDKEMD